MLKLTEEMRRSARDILAKKEAEVVIGWQKGDFYWQSPPAFAEDKAAASTLMFDSFSVNNLSKYLLEELQSHEKVALYVKGCDARGINRLLQDNRVARERLLIIGIPCLGMVDSEKLVSAGLDVGLQKVERQGEELLLTFADTEKKVLAGEYLLDKCRECKYPNPVVYDYLLGEEVEKPRSGNPMAGVDRIEKLATEEKFNYWAKKLDRCIRCYACRNICPACNCRECIFDQDTPRWIGKANRLSEKQNYQAIRAFHVAGRCIDCGECERACPMEIPIQEINRKIIKDINEMYGDYEAGLDPEDNPPLGTYRNEDPAGFNEA